METLQDIADQGEHMSKALAAQSEKRAKQYAWLAVLSSPIVGILVPLLLKWLAVLIVEAP